MNRHRCALNICGLRRWPAAVVAVALIAVVVSAAESDPQKHCGRLPQASSRAAHHVRLSLDEVYASADTVPIPDFPGDTAQSVITITDNVWIEDINVFVDIRHPWIRDLRISLTASGSAGEVVLLDLLPMDSVRDIHGWFDDDAGVSILAADTPLTGVWRPVQPLTAFHSRSAAGTWTLRVYDRFRLDSGYVAGWAISINAAVNLRGTVRNALTNAPLRGATVSVAGLGFTARTASNGVYEFSDLPPGAHTLQFAKADYESLTVPDVLVTGSAVTVLDTVMATRVGYFEFASIARAVAIPDTERAVMPLVVNHPVRISDLDVTVNLSHTYLGDIDLSLESPGGTTVRLMEHSLNNSAAGLVDCRFDDEAALSITQGSYPYTGRFRPVGSLNALNGASAAGTWNLIAVDTAPRDTGTILDFALHVEGEMLAAHDRSSRLPRRLVFHGCSPNPFNSRAEFRFDLLQPGQVRLTLHDVLGREVAVVAEGPYAAGLHRVSFDGGALPTGLYFARLISGDAADTQKIVLLK